jgi:hypothetical protein
MRPLLLALIFGLLLLAVSYLVIMGQIRNERRLQRQSFQEGYQIGFMRAYNYPEAKVNEIEAKWKADSLQFEDCLFKN